MCVLMPKVWSMDCLFKVLVFYYYIGNKIMLFWKNGNKITLFLREMSLLCHKFNRYVKCSKKYDSKMYS